LKGAIPVGVSATYLGEEAGYLLVLHDWRKKRKEEREHEQHLKETEGFLHIASHELRHPLTIMHACVPLLPRVLDNDEKREEVLGLIESGLNKMDYLVRDLLDASRLESGRFAIEKRELDLSVFLEEVAEEMRINHTDREFMMNQNGDVLFLEADSEKLRQAFVILMENAVKYTNSLVEIECKQQNGDVMISVLDRGPGIPAEEQEQIFDQFYRADKVQQGSASRGGLGLGLYIAKKIVEGHDGEIGCFSREGGGAEFRITLPRSGE
jgi:signal transduction histidine kinase